MMTSLGRRAASTIAQRSAPHVNLCAARDARADTVAPAVVTAVSQLTPAVTQLMLRVDDARFGYARGTVGRPLVGDGVGGFSICSDRARMRRALELAVKAPARAPAGRAPPPVTEWCVARARAGDRRRARAARARTTRRAAAAARGGRSCSRRAASASTRCCRAPRPQRAQLRDERAPTPRCTVRPRARRRRRRRRRAPPSATLLYAASDLREFAFREDLERLAAEFPADVRCEFFLDADGCASEARTAPRA